MIKRLYLEDFDLLYSIDSNIKSKKTYLKKYKENIIIEGYYNNNSLQSFIIYKKEKHREVFTIVYIAALNKFSLLKNLIYSLQKKIKYNDLYVSMIYIEYINILSKFRLLDISYTIKYKKIKINYLDFNSDVLNIHSYFYLDDFIVLYSNVKNKICNTKFMKNKRIYINSYFKYKIKTLNEIDKNNKIKVMLKTHKLLYNNGEINYIKKLKENGYIEIPYKSNVFTQKSYSIKKVITNNNKHICNIEVYNIIEFDASKSIYRNTPSFYRNKSSFIYNFIKNNIQKHHYYILDNEGRIFPNSLKLAPLNTIYLNCLILNQIYIEEMQKDFKKYDIEYSFKTFELNYSILQCKRSIGKEETTKFFNKYFKMLEKNKNFNFHHDTFVMYYREVIYSPYLTKKAMTKVLNMPFNKVKKYVLFEQKIEYIDTIDTKIKRKIVSSFIKKDTNINNLYNDLLSKYAKDVLGDISKEDIEKINKFVNSLNKYSRDELIEYNYFIQMFKEKTLDVVNGKIKSIFDEYIVDERQKKIGNLVKEILGSKKENKKSLLKNPKKLYNDLRKIYNVNKIIEGNFPRKYIYDILDKIKLRNIEIPKDILYWCKIEKKCSPEYLMAGDITDCCMNLGTTKSIIYALEEGFGIISIYNDNEIISNSVIWIQNEYKYLVLDNIEAIERFKKYNDLIANQYLIISNYIKEKFNLKHIVQDSSHNDIFISDEEIVENDMELYLEQNGLNINEEFYSDANYIYPLNLKEFEEIKNEINYSTNKKKAT